MVIYAWGELATAAEVNISIGLDTERVRWQIYRKAIKELRQYAQDYEVPVLLANPHTGSYPFLTTI
jgi:sugar phosphate isomerase/epimerase